MTIDTCLQYSVGEKHQPHAYTDSAFADCPETRKSHSGYVVIAGGSPIAWSSGKQDLVTTSSTEAEYVAMGHAARIAGTFSRLLQGLKYDD